ncbi:MAG: hypothetical protein FJ318_03980 [SAR202 cluster bacterium]|nr:hypothetical protein [SAR202 cluster bacterium]
MIRYETSIPSTMTGPDAFAYMSDFTNSVDWDPNVISARRATDGDIGLGTAFDLVSKFAWSRVPLRYVVTAYDAPRRVALTAQKSTFDGIDTITVARDNGRTVVTYDARLVFKGIARVMEPFVGIVFRRVARSAAEGLQRVLNPAAAGRQPRR